MSLVTTIVESWEEEPSHLEKELLKLRSLIDEVGGNGDSIMRKLGEVTADDLLYILITNGITFEIIMKEI